MERGAWRLSSLNKSAVKLGLQTAMSLADAKALVPDLGAVPEQPERVLAFLKALTRWSLRYTPWVAAEPPDGLVLEITGCAHLFGGEAALAQVAHDRLRAMGLSACIGIADTKGAAWALAHFASSRMQAISAVPAGEAQAMRAVLGALPVAALRIDDLITRKLQRVGLRCIADIAALPRAALTRRFGPLLAQRMDQLFGEIPEPVSPMQIEPPYAVRLHLPEPIGLTGDLQAGLERLLQRLCLRLRREQKGACALRLSIQRCDGSVDAADIGLARAMDDPSRIARLFERAIGAFDAGFGIDALRLEALEVAPIKPEQMHALGTHAARDDLSELIARLGNHIGFDRVLRFAPRDSHLPERSYALVPAASFTPMPFEYQGPPRPPMIFTPEPVMALDQSRGAAAAPPARFRWRRTPFETQDALGPERIAPQWWCEDPDWRSGPRDYWRVQTRQGHRLWLFHTPAEAGRWFVQGEFL
ncbi:MAG: DNA polymerase Y family protein [Neomegalonema sp.]|nr:DNA polymerase Y family protein [Neomegalonema sp.]